MIREEIIAPVRTDLAQFLQSVSGLEVNAVQSDIEYSPQAARNIESSVTGINGVGPDRAAERAALYRNALHEDRGATGKSPLQSYDRAYLKFLLAKEHLTEARSLRSLILPGPGDPELRNDRIRQIRQHRADAVILLTQAIAGGTAVEGTAELALVLAEAGRTREATQALGLAGLVAGLVEAGNGRNVFASVTRGVAQTRIRENTTNAQQRPVSKATAAASTRRWNTYLAAAIKAVGDGAKVVPQAALN